MKQFSFCLVFCSLLCNFSYSQPVINPVPTQETGDVIDVHCDGCFTPDLPESCMDLVTIVTRDCSEDTVVWVNGEPKCLGYGHRDWKEDLWLRRVKPVVGGTGQKCEKWVWKACAEDVKCESWSYEQTLPDGTVIEKFACTGSAVSVDNLFQIDKYPVGESCSRPGNPWNPEIGDPFFDIP